MSSDETLSVTFSDLAARELDRATDSYRQRVIGRARSISSDGEVDKSHILVAEKELQPVSATGRTLTQDWLKRIGFAALAGGIPWLVIALPWVATNPLPVFAAGALVLAGTFFTGWAVVSDLGAWADIRQQNRLRQGH